MSARTFLPMTMREQDADGLSVLRSPRPAAPPLHLEIPAQAQHLAFVRHKMTHWLDGIGISEELAADILLVVVEACSNSIEHAYRNAELGVVRVSAHLDGTAICITVDDSGHWKAELIPDRTRGRGMPLMRAMSTRFELSTGPSGTSVSMAFDAPSRLPRT